MTLSAIDEQKWNEWKDEIRNEIDPIDKWILAILSNTNNAVLQILSFKRKSNVHAIFLNHYTNKIYDEIERKIKINPKYEAHLKNLIFNRLVLVYQMWELKTKYNKDTRDDSRWNDLKAEKILIWKEFWLDEQVVDDIWEFIHEIALKIENSVKAMNK